MSTPISGARDAAYDNFNAIPDAAAYPEAWEDAAFDWRGVESAIGRAYLNQSYGAAERQKLDLFLPAGRPEGLLVFVHGGWWMKFDRTLWSHFAAGATARGWAVAMPSYTLAPQARISEITQEIAAAITYAAGRVAGPIALAGHSAGGHLVARMAMQDSPLAPEVGERIGHVMAISPLSDLRDLMDLTLNDTLRLDMAEAGAESPALHTPRAGLPVTVWVGGAELAAFHDHAKWLATAWDCDLVTAPNAHHFDVIDPLRDPESEMLTCLLSS